MSDAHEVELDAALTAWAALLGTQRVLSEPQAQARYGFCTSPIRRKILAAVLPSNAPEVAEIVKIAVRFQVALYPISTGHNWGYGTANPARDDCVIVDLSGLHGIVDFDPELGLATLEPGVTQQELADYLNRHGHAFMVPTTGAGPSCSVVGNALERGYGITPIADHFAAVTSIEAVLPDGRLYRPALSELGAEGVDRAFKWGVGPYIDGLFAQGGFGIVTRATIALARRPRGFAAFFFAGADDGSLEALVEATHQIMGRLSGVTGSINLMNQRRVLAMTVPYPRQEVDQNGLLPQDTIARLGRENQVMAWSGVGALYGEPEVVAAAKRVVRNILRPVSDRFLFMTPARTTLLRRLSLAFPGITGQRLRRMADAVAESLKIMRGQPSEVALQLAYWKKGGAPQVHGLLDPARDGSGLIWYPPLVPMRSDAVRQYVAHVTSTCISHGIEPLITLTALSERCFDSSVPLLFDRDSEVEAAAAEKCYRALFTDGLALGFAPYRLSPQIMQEVVGADTVCWDLVAKLKSAADPANILAPGRYVRLSNGR